MSEFDLSWYDNKGPLYLRAPLNDQHLQMIWNAFSAPESIPRLRVSVPLANSILIAALTVQQIGEVLGMRVSQIDFKSGTWVTRIGKNSVYAVPLTPFALHIVQETIGMRADKDSDWIFQSVRDPKQRVQETASTKLFGKVRHVLEWPQMHIRDLRVTAQNRMRTGALNIEPETIARVLGHRDLSDRERFIFARNFTREHRKALLKWETHLMAVVRSAKV